MNILNAIKEAKLSKQSRQIRTLIICTFIVFTLIYARIKHLDVSASVIPDEYEKIAVTIMEGDRAWNIQSKLTPDENIRKILYYVDMINEKDVTRISPGEKIMFLQIKNK